MHWRSKKKDGKGRIRLSCEEMAELYRGFHKSLSDTYYEAASNHKICTDAMEAIRMTHVSKKTASFLLNFTALIREVYSHAHYNVQELLYDERHTIRTTYFHSIEELYDVVLKRADHVWQHPSAEKMSILVQFASLFSLYKDVGTEEFISKVYMKSVEWMQSPHKQTNHENNIMFDYFDQIQLAYRLRKEKRRGSILSLEPVTARPRLPSEAEEPETPKLAYRKSRLATKDELDACFEKITHEAKHCPKKQDSVHSSHSEPEEESPDSSPTPSVQALSALPERRGSKSIALPDIKHILRNLHPVAKQEIPPKQPADLEVFDYKAEFEKRLSKKRGSATIADLPVIAKPKTTDRISYYRRRPLFDTPENLKKDHSRLSAEDGQEDEIPSIKITTAPGSENDNTLSVHRKDSHKRSASDVARNRTDGETPILHRSPSTPTVPPLPPPKPPRSFTQEIVQSHDLRSSQGSSPLTVEMKKTICETSSSEFNAVEI